MIAGENPSPGAGSDGPPVIDAMTSISGVSAAFQVVVTADELVVDKSGDLMTIQAESEALTLELQQLRRIERAFLFSHRSTADTRRQIEEVQARIAANERALPELRREARAKGIPAGWLRPPRGG